MTPRRHHSSSRDGRGMRAVALACLIVAAGIAAHPRRAAAQACCVGTGLITPARLRTFESAAVGFQVGLWAPFVQTSRQAGGLSGFGGGLGDVAANARFDAIDAGTRGHWPGVALLASLSFPTGQAPDQGGPDDPLSTSGTGTGSFEGNVGVALEEIIGQGFVSVAGWAAKRTARSANGVEQSFAPRLSALLSGGYTFGHDVTVGAFASALRQGDNHDANGPIANSGVALVTAGGALALPFWQVWRLQSTLFTDLPIAGWGQNQTVGFGGTVAVIRSWI